MITAMIAMKGCGPSDDRRDTADQTADPRIAEIMGEMTDRQKIGQLVMATTIWDEGMSDTGDAYDPPSDEQLDHMRRMVQDYHAGSVIVYNWGRAETMAAFNRQLQDWAVENEPGIPLFISADLEYGVAQRIPDEATVFPRQMGVAATGNPDNAYEQGRITAVEGIATGFNWSYSPVVDVNVNPRNPVIGVRSFGESLPLISEMTRAMVKGSQEHGVIATPKHFPGHGDTEFDSHYDLSTVTYDEQTLREIHLPPFQEAFDAGADAIMTAHVIIEALDPDVPATLSERVLTGLLRDEMGFEGIVVTDAMSMDAIDEHWGAGEAAVMAVQAGADIIMATGSPEEQVETFEALYQAYRDGDITPERLDASVARILRIKKKYNLIDNFTPPEPMLANDVTRYSGHLETAQRIAEESITLLRNEDILPFDGDREATTLVAGVAYTDELAERVSGAAAGDVITWNYGDGPTDNDPDDRAIRDAVEKAADADRILIFTYSAGELPEGQEKLVEALQETGKPLAVVALGLPYDILSFPDVPAYIASYALDRWPDATPTPVVWEAAVNAVFGAEPGGTLPVEVGSDYPVGHGLSYGQ